MTPHIEIRTEERPSGRVGFVTVCNEAKLNVLGRALMCDLIAAFATLSADPALRAVVLSGAGDRATIGGADIAEMASLDADTARAFITVLHQVCAAIRTMPVPVIARLQGYTLGAGLEIAASCDLRIASDGARFGMPEVRIGIPSVIEAALLPTLIGWGRTRRLLFTGEMINAKRAAEWGLVEEVAPPAHLDATIERLLTDILSAGPRTIRLQKALIRTWEGLTPDAAVAAGIECFAEAWRSDEPRTMMQTFLDAKQGRVGAE